MPYSLLQTVILYSDTKLTIVIHSQIHSLMCSTPDNHAVEMHANYTVTGQYAALAIQYGKGSLKTFV